MEYWEKIRKKVGKEPLIMLAAGAVLQNERGEVLLQKRVDSGKWGIPGGMMELGESAEMTAIREVYEETGLTIHIVDMLGVYTKYFHKYENGDSIQMCSIFFRASLKDGKLIQQNEETAELKYFSEETLPEIFHCQHLDALRDFFSQKKGVFR